MADLSDERLRFYLKNRTQIEAWAALSGEAALAVDSLLDALADDVESLRADLETDVSLCIKTEGEAYPHFLLHRQGWRCDPKNPRAAVGIEWRRNKTFLEGSASPWVGVRFTIGDEETRLLRNRFRDAAKSIRAQRGDTASAWWPVYALVPADPEFWIDVDAYRRRLIDALRSAWEAYSAPLEQLFCEEHVRAEDTASD